MHPGLEEVVVGGWGFQSRRTLWGIATSGGGFSDWSGSSHHRRRQPLTFGEMKNDDVLVMARLLYSGYALVVARGYGSCAEKKRSDNGGGRATSHRNNDVRHLPRILVNVSGFLSHLV